MKPSKENKYIMANIFFYMLTSIITIITTNATENGPNNKIELADIGVYKAWQFSIYNIMIDCIFVAG